MEAKLGFIVLACSSALAVYSYWDDASSVAFVLLADTAVVLLFLAGRGDKIKAAVWALTTLLTAMFASRVAPLTPPPVAAVVLGPLHVSGSMIVAAVQTLRGFVLARAGDESGGVGAEDAAHGHVRVQDGASHAFAVAALVWATGVATAAGGFWAFFL